MNELREQFTDEAWSEMEKIVEITDFDDVEQVAEFVLEQRTTDPDVEGVVEDDS